MCDLTLDFCFAGSVCVPCTLQQPTVFWNQLPASLLASLPCKLNTFRKRVKNVVTSKGIEVGIECK
jgi:hypothetical protein